MRKLEVADGEEYGQLKVIGEVSTSGRRKFRCKCTCGSEVDVRLDHLKSGHTSSCGGCGIEHAGKRMTLKKWASLYGIKESTLRARLRIMGMREALERG